MSKGRTTRRWRYIRSLAWERDKAAQAVCHLCGQPIDYSLEPSSCDAAWEPDHIMPFVKAPELELDLTNIAASHRRCNRSRGFKDEDKIGMHSRIW